jgi:plastocyanin
MRNRVRFLSACLLALPMVFCQHVAAKVWTVDVADFSFSPSNLTVMAGDTVRWEWISGSHTTTSGTSCSANGLWNATISSLNQSFQRQFGSPGSFPYFCVPHCFSGMTGTITVEMVTGILDGRDAAALPEEFDLGQNFPNPFNASTVITYTVMTTAEVSLEVFDILGRRVLTLVHDRLSPGIYEATWEGRDTAGREVASGVYFYRLITNDQTYTKTMVMMK